MNTAQISIRARDGTLLSISVLIVPSIAIPLRSDTQASITELPYLCGLPLAHLVMSTDNFKISLVQIIFGRPHNLWKWANSHELEESVNTTTSLHVSTHCYNNKCDWSEQQQGEQISGAMFTNMY